jgi:hypothetical protein
MRENIAIVADCMAVLMVIAALWLASYSRSLWASVLGILAIGTMSSMAMLRAYPEPTRSSLEERVSTLERQNRELTERLGAASGKIDQLDRQLVEERDKLKQKEAEAAAKTNDVLSATAQAARAQTSAKRIARLFLGTLQSELFDIVSLQGQEYQEYIVGKKGFYYAIELKDAEGRGRLVFPKGQYEADGEQIKQAAAHVSATLLEALRDGEVQYQVFLRGGATQESWDGPTTAGQEFGPVSYRENASSSAYGELSEPMLFSPPITNKHLPLLRAAFARSILGGPFSDAELLNKAPSDSKDELERTVEIILYLKP